MFKYTLSYFYIEDKYDFVKKETKKKINEFDRETGFGIIRSLTHEVIDAEAGIKCLKVHYQGFLMHYLYMKFIYIKYGLGDLVRLGW